MPNKKLICPYCKSENIVCDACAEWNIEKQEWVLLAVYDEMTCNDCGEDFRFADEIQIEPQPTE